MGVRGDSRGLGDEGRGQELAAASGRAAAWYLVRFPVGASAAAGKVEAAYGPPDEADSSGLGLRLPPLGGRSGGAAAAAGSAPPVVDALASPAMTFRLRTVAVSSLVRATPPRPLRGGDGAGRDGGGGRRKRRRWLVLDDVPDDAARARIVRNRVAAGRSNAARREARLAARRQRQPPPPPAGDNGGSEGERGLPPEGGGERQGGREWGEAAPGRSWPEPPEGWGGREGGPAAGGWVAPTPLSLPQVPWPQPPPA